MAAYRESYIFRLETETPVMLWTGHGDLILPADGVLDAPTVAAGGGALVDIPDLEMLLNGVAQRIEITLSGVAPEALALALVESAEVPGAAAYIGRIRFDEAWQPDGPVQWEWTGEGRGLTVSGDDTATGRSRSLILKLAAGDTTRSRSLNAFFTDPDQRRDYPDDAFFSHVGAINTGTTRRWGPA